VRKVNSKPRTLKYDTKKHTKSFIRKDEEKYQNYLKDGVDKEKRTKRPQFALIKVACNVLKDEKTRR
jgi:hypothetical protein